MRREGARAIQAVYAELGFPPISDDEIEAAVVAHASEDMPARDVVADLQAADAFSGRRPDHPGGSGGLAAAASRRLPPLSSKWAANASPPTTSSRPRCSTTSFACRARSTSRTTMLALAAATRGWPALGRIQQIRQRRSPRDFIAEQLGAPVAQLAPIGPARAGSAAK